VNYRNLGPLQRAVLTELARRGTATAADLTGLSGNRTHRGSQSAVATVLLTLGRRGLAAATGTDDDGPRRPGRRSRIWEPTPEGRRLAARMAGQT